jgi:integrase
MKIKQLLEEASTWLRDHDYTKSTIYVNYVRLWNGFAKSTDKDTEYYETMSDNYIIKKYGRDIMSEDPSVLPLKEYRVYRAFHALEEFHTAQTISGTSMAGATVRRALPEYENSALEKYTQHMVELDYSANTKRYYRATVHHYLLFCPLSTISDSQVLGYFDSIAHFSKKTVKSRLKILKSFHEFCQGQGILETDYGVLFPSAKTRRNTEIPSVYTPDEISALLNYLQNHDQNRKRNYAIALMAAVHGFRSGDIVSMTHADIDWDSGAIRIIQSKTNNVVEQHLIPQSGNALADYLLNERPDSSDPHIFLKRNGCALKSTSISTMIFNAYNKSSIVTKGRKHGSHSLRHSLASNMLASDIGILDISKVLGHSDVDTTWKFYAKVDIAHLHLCGLEVPVDEN